MVVGSPNFAWGSTRVEPADYWLPKHPSYEYEQGETINNIDQTFDYYLKHVQNWTYCIRPDIPGTYHYFQSFLHEAGLSTKDADMKIRSLAENRYKRPIAFTLTYSVSGIQSGQVIWLPATNSISSYEAINLLLRERYKIFSENNPPEWLAKFPLPLEIPVRNRIIEIKKSIAELEVEENEQKKRLVEVTTFHKLLYETGEGILEPVVRNALKELGAEVEEPKTKGREDGRLKDPFGREATLEIKGREGTLRQKDINELDRWVRDSLVLEDHHSKGILIGNLMREQDLSNRVDIYPDNCLKAAKNSEICLLTTAQIYRLFRTNKMEYSIKQSSGMQSS